MVLNENSKNKSAASPPSVDPSCRIDTERYRVFIEDVADGFYETNLRGDFVFFNEAFCRIFGYSRREMQHQNYREFMTEKNAEIAFENFNKVFRTGEGFTDILWEVNRKDGSARILKISANKITDDKGKISGFRGIARDVTREKKAARTNLALFRIAKALPRFRQLNQLLDFIIKEVQDLIQVEGAMVILIDEEKNEFYFPVATFDDAETGKRFKEVRFPLNEGVAGHVYRTGEPMIVPDYYSSPYSYLKVDDQTEHTTRNMLDVPILLQDRMIGVLCAVNKKDREFSSADVFLMTTIASTVALPIENTRINDELNRSYEEVQSLNRAKDRVIHHLSHELKTPVSVMSATLSQLEKNFDADEKQKFMRPLDRMLRNLNRILEMQYEIEDILRQRDYPSHQMLSILLDVCADELEALVAQNLTERDIVDKIRHRIDEIFGPRESVSEEIVLAEFVEAALREIRLHFSHRSCELLTNISPVGTILIPPEVLKKIIFGLVKNAVENTPDGGRIRISVNTGKEGPEMIVKDYGVGITAENQRLIFESNVSVKETLNYASRNPFDFNAGGKGFDLLRMRIFSERYHFKIQMNSSRCHYIPRDADLCPGYIERCEHCKSPEDCHRSGGTTVYVRFSPADMVEDP